ncbi:MAG: BlaI/MecI/CopY family transcriptional regulator [Verrucomicrobia bacterium]|nr:BlaI/MecI/CopY family transcriptional regulator [Verrucomicrobiota bacterium]
MKNRELPKISEAEWDVMKLLWDKAPRPVSEIVTELAAKNEWQPRTIRTLISRLVQKRALRARRQENRRVYEPAVSLDECVRHVGRSFLERVFGGAPVSMLLHFVKETDLTPDEIEKLKQALSEKARKS